MSNGKIIEFHVDKMEISLMKYHYYFCISLLMLNTKNKSINEYICNLQKLYFRL